MTVRTGQDHARLAASIPARAGHAETSALLVASICAAEVVLVFVHIGVGFLLHAIVLGAILYLQAKRSRSVDRGTLVPLALVPLLRILSLTMPLPGLAPMFWTGLVGVPLAVGAVLAARTLGFGPAELGLRATPWRSQVAIAALGLPTGLLAWLSGGSNGLVRGDATPFEILVVALLLVMFVAFTEEFVFRGVVQAGLSNAFGNGAIVLGTILYGSMYLGSMSFAYAALMTAVGLLHGVLADRTGSIVGVVASHAILVLGAFFVWPTLLA